MKKNKALGLVAVAVLSLGFMTACSTKTSKEENVIKITKHTEPVQTIGHTNYGFIEISKDMYPFKDEGLPFEMPESSGVQYSTTDAENIVTFSGFDLPEDQNIDEFLRLVAEDLVLQSEYQTVPDKNNIPQKVTSHGYEEVDIEGFDKTYKIKAEYGSKKVITFVTSPSGTKNEKIIIFSTEGTDEFNDKMVDYFTTTWKEID